MSSNHQLNTNESHSNKIVVGLDIGTTKIIALVAQKNSNDNSLNILGIGIAESEGINRGVVVNIERTVKAIKNVIEQAEKQSGVKIEEVIVGIAGDHIDSFKTRGIIGISSPNQEISKADVQRLIDETRRVAIPSERKILHVIPQDYVIDGQDGIHEPIGMSGVRLEANVHIVTGLSTAIKNLYTCVERAGIKVRDLVLEPLASSYATLSDEEKEVGVALIDIGGGTTDIAIFEENIIRFTSVFGIAGKQVTDDIRQGLGIISKHAERIKREYGHAFNNSIHKDEIFMIPGINGRNPIEVSKSLLCNIIQPRMEEIFELAYSEILRSGYEKKLGAGIVITGGTTLIRGTEDLAQEVFGKPVKIGMPSGVTYSGLAPEIENPVYSTVVGLALYGLDETEELYTSNHFVTNSNSDEPKKDTLADSVQTKIEDNTNESAVDSKDDKVKDPKKSIWHKSIEFIKNL